jgi:hypothetical protein
MQLVAKPKPSIYSRRDMLSVNQITNLIPGNNGGSCSRQHVYNLIDRGELKPAFRFGTRRGLFVPREVVERYVARCIYDPSV